MAIRSWRDKQPPHEQLPMFMSAREIAAKHQGLDADREEVIDPSMGPTFFAPHRPLIPGEAPGVRSTQEIKADMTARWNPQGSPDQRLTERSASGRLVLGSSQARWETDAELFARKANEARTYPSEGQSLSDAVRAHGVQKPITLSTEQFGEHDKPEILGGHHRLAAALEHAPDRLIPVLHDNDIESATSREDYT